MHSKKETIDFMGIGAGRAGTSWIYQCLKEHPEVCVSSKKEIHFFNKNHGFHRANAEWNYKKGLDWYLKHFEHCDEKKIKGEMDVRYLYEKNALQLIKKHFPYVKIIITLRNPSERAYSNYYYHIQKHPEYKKIAPTFEDAIKNNPEFLEEGLYYQPVKNCFEIFPRKNILILIFDDLKKDPESFVRNIYSFLSVDSSFVPTMLNKKVNKSRKTKDVIVRILQKIKGGMMQYKAGRWFVELFKKNDLDIKMRKYTLIRSKRPPMKQSTRKKLQEYYRDDVINLEKLISKDFSSWI